jgi:hypothetical protein
MSALNIKRGSTSHSAYDLRDPNAPWISAIMLRPHGVEKV